jgi:hypothetical protein
VVSRANFCQYGSVGLVQLRMLVVSTNNSDSSVANDWPLLADLCRLYLTVVSDPQLGGTRPIAGIDEGAEQTLSYPIGNKLRL